MGDQAVLELLFQADDQMSAVFDQVQGNLSGLIDAFEQAGSMDLFSGAVDQVGQLVDQFSTLDDAASTTTDTLSSLGSGAGDGLDQIDTSAQSASDALQALDSDAASTSDALSGLTAADLAASMSDAAAAISSTDSILSSLDDTVSQGEALLSQYGATAADAASGASDLGSSFEESQGSAEEASGAWKEGSDSLSELTDKAVETGGSAIPGLSSAVDTATGLWGAFNAEAESSGEQLAIVGAGIAAVGIGLSGISFAKFESGVESLHQLSLESGLTTTQVSGLQTAMQAAGVSADSAGRVILTFQRNLQSMQTTIDSGKEPTSAFSKALADIGVSAEGADGQVRTLQQLLPEIMDAFQRNAEAGGQAAGGFNEAGVAAQLFGARIGGQLLPMLDEGSAAYDKFTASAAAMSMGSEEQVRHLEDWNMASATLKQTMQGLADEVGSDVAPIMTQLADLTDHVVHSIQQVPAPALDAGLAMITLGGGAIAAFGAWEKLGPTIEGALEHLIVWKATEEGSAALSLEAAGAADVETASMEALAVAEGEAAAASEALTLTPVGAALLGLAVAGGIAIAAVEHFTGSNKDNTASLDGNTGALDANTAAKQRNALPPGVSDTSSPAVMDKLIGELTTAYQQYQDAQNKFQQDSQNAMKQGGSFDLSAEATQVNNLHDAYQRTADALDGYTAKTGSSVTSQSALNSWIQGTTASANALTPAIQGIAAAATYLADAGKSAFDEPPNSPTEQAVATLHTAIDQATLAFQNATTARDALLKGPTDQQSSLNTSLLVAQAELAGYKETMASTAPGSAAFADAQQHVAELTNTTIPALQGSKAAVDSQTTAFDALFNQWKTGKISGDEFNASYAAMASSTNGQVTPSVQQLKDAVDAANTTQTTATQTANDMSAALEAMGHSTGSAATGFDATTASWSALGQSVADASGPITNGGTQLGQLGTDATTAGGAVDSAGTVMSTSLDQTGGHLDTSRSNFLDWHTTSSKAAGDTASDTQTATSGIQGSLSDTGGALSTSTGEFQDWQHGGTAAVETLASTILSDLASLQDEALQAGNAIGQAIDDGITAGIAYNSGAIAAAAAGAVNQAVAAAQAAGQISSPSRRTYDDVGTPLAQGIANALSDAGGVVAKAMATLVDNAINTAGGELTSVPSELAGSPFSATMHQPSDWNLGQHGDWNIGQHDDWNISQHTGSDWSMHQHGGAHGGASGPTDPAAALTALAAAANLATAALNGLAGAANGHGGGAGSASDWSIGQHTAGDAQWFQHSGIPSDVQTWEKQAPAELESTGRAMMDGLTQGVKSAGSDLVTAMQSVFDISMIQPAADSGTQAAGEFISNLRAGVDTGSPMLAEMVGITGKTAADSFSVNFEQGGDFAITTLSQKIADPGGFVINAAQKSGQAAGTAFAQSYNAAAAAGGAPSSGGSGSSSGGGGGGGGLGLLQPGIGLGTSTDGSATASGQHLSAGEVADWKLTQWAMSLDIRQPDTTVNVNVLMNQEQIGAGTNGYNTRQRRMNARTSRLP